MWPYPIEASATATKIGWYGESAVRLAIHAPLIPARTKTSGTTRQDIAATPPRIAPTAAAPGRRGAGTASDRENSGAISLTPVAVDDELTTCSGYSFKSRIPWLRS